MCDCVEKLNESLKEKNGRIETALQMSNNMGSATIRVLVATEKIDSKQRTPVPRVAASFCPFCGEKQL